jgi:hydrogenase maturation factor
MNFRQFRRSEIVQAARITQIDPYNDHGVFVADVDGLETTIVSIGLFDNGKPQPGDYLLVHPNGAVEWTSAGDFAAQWEPVRGPSLI